MSSVSNLVACYWMLWSLLAHLSVAWTMKTSVKTSGGSTLHTVQFGLSRGRSTSLMLARDLSSDCASSTNSISSIYAAADLRRRTQTYTSASISADKPISQNRQVRSGPLSTTEDFAFISSRRTFLGASLAMVLACSLSPRVSLAASAESSSNGRGDSPLDALDALGEQLSNMQEFELDESQPRWPESPSPLPTRKRSAHELTVEDDVTTSIPFDSKSDLGEALNKASKKRQIDPRTHG